MVESGPASCRGRSTAAEAAGSWFLPGHVGGVFVVAQAEESRMAELARRGPFSEADLADQARLDPVHAGSWHVAARVRRLGALDPAPRVRVAADHELLGVLAFELQPVLGPARPVRRVSALGDHALPALAAGLLPVRLGPAGAVRAGPQRAAKGQHAAELLLALQERHTAQIRTIREHDIEHVVVHRNALDQSWQRRG